MDYHRREGTRLDQGGRGGFGSGALRLGLLRYGVTLFG
jgi:hypothetical protein